MMANGGFIRIHCETCGTTWEIYGTTVYAEDANRCPCCNARIAHSAWRLIMEADDAVTHAQYALAEADEHNAPRFQVDFIDRSLYPNRNYSRGDKP